MDILDESGVYPYWF